MLAEMLVSISEELLEVGRCPGGRGRRRREAAVRELVAWHVDFALHNKALIVVQDRDWSSLPEDARERVRTLQREYVELWVTAHRGRAARARPAQGRAMAHAAFGLINSTPHSTFLSEPEMAGLLGRDGRPPPLGLDWLTLAGMSLLDLPIARLDGTPSTLGEITGRRPALLVNVASKCGLTPQYAKLEELHEKFAPRGFTVVGVPCNQFGGQEPGSSEEIAEFCSATYGVTFPMTEKVDVNGDEPAPALRRAHPGAGGRRGARGTSSGTSRSSSSTATAPSCRASAPSPSRTTPRSSRRSSTPSRSERAVSSRHLAYVGEPVSLQSLLLDPPQSLAAQSWSPRTQLHGVVNADGFGAGWYAFGREEPVRYRRAQPIWTDASFASLAPTIASSCILGAVRSDTTSFAHDESVVAPFAQGRWLFSHNGKVRGLAQRPPHPLRAHARHPRGGGAGRLRAGLRARRLPLDRRHPAGRGARRGDPRGRHDRRRAAEHARRRRPQHRRARRTASGCGCWRRRPGPASPRSRTTTTPTGSRSPRACWSRATSTG